MPLYRDANHGEVSSLPNSNGRVHLVVEWTAQNGVPTLSSLGLLSQLCLLNPRTQMWVWKSLQIKNINWVQLCKA